MSLRHHVQALAGGALGAVGRMRAVPQRRMRLLQRLDLHRHVLELVVLAVPGQRLGRERLEDQLQPLGIDLLPVLGVLPVVGNLVGHRAAAETDLQPPAAHVIEHADFLQHPQRVMDRQRIDEGAEAQPLGALRDRREEHAGRGRHAERREVMLGDVIGVEARAVEGFDHLQPLLVVVAQRQVVAVEVIEDAEFQAHAGCVHSICALIALRCSSIQPCGLAFSIMVPRLACQAVSCATSGRWRSALLENPGGGLVRAVRRCWSARAGPGRAWPARPRPRA